MDILNYDINLKTDKKIILCSTEKFWKIATFCLINKKLEVWKYCDIEEQNNGQQRHISIENAFEEVRNDNALLLIALGKNVLYYLNKLETEGFEVVYSMRYLISMESLRKSDLYHECQSSIETMGDMFFYEDAYMHKNKIYISSIDATVTSRCSLKCKDCSNLMQYYSKPQNYDVEEISKTLDIILQKIDMLNDLRILGGEPFMNNQFVKIIDKFKNHSKIRKISVYSNATIFPDKVILESLKKSNVLLVFSDYGVLSRSLHQWEKWCTDNGVAYFVERVDWWQDCGKLQRHNYTEYELLDIYSNCECRSVPTIMGNKLFPCQYVANAANLGAMYTDEVKKDYLTIDDTVTGKKIFSFLYERKYLEGCRYCGGRNEKRAKVEPHIQLGQALSYERLNKRKYDNKTESYDIADSNRRLSVVIPVYNTYAYLKECLESVIAQTYNNLEIIIVDDGSTDGSLELIKEIAEKSYRKNDIIVLENNHRGVVEARNSGIHIASGEFITFVDSDDYIDKNYFSTLMVNMRDCDYLRTNYMQVVSNSKQSDEHLNGQDRYYTILKSFFKKGEFHDEEMIYIWRYMFVNSLFFMENCLYAALYKTQIMKDICDLVEKEIIYGEDRLYTFLYLVRCNKVKFIEENGYFYRIRESASRYDWANVIFNMEKWYNVLLRDFQNHEQKLLLMEGAQREYSYLISACAKNRFNLNQVEWNYPYLGCMNGMKIALYGAGSVGKNYWKYIVSEGKCELVVWVDKNAEQIKRNEMLPVVQVDELSKYSFDKIIIAVYSKKAAEDISEELEYKGILKEKILWKPTIPADRLIGAINNVILK